MLEFYCLVFFGSSMPLLREQLSASAGFFKERDAMAFYALAGLGFA